ncbi:MAG: diacylglycerol O-acyltransferase / wax synthase [Actinomycetota bacterium]|nr:diacylglycerol O-acyltransferase / wax synthase [Actinomycetota bacterium]
MERLSGFDATFVYAESPVSRFEIASCIVVDPPSSLVPYAFDTVRDVVASRVHLEPRMRQRLVHVPLELGRPVWVDDPDFDIGNHLKRGALPAPGGQEELEHYIEDVLSRPLDRDKPLWELHVIEGLEGGRVAGLVKTHHAAVDGVAGFEMLMTFLDSSADAPPVELANDRWDPAAVPSPLGLAAGAVGDVVSQPVRSLQLFTGLARGAWRRRSAGPSEADPNVDRSARVGRADAPPTRFNTKITGSRRVGLVDLDFDDVKQIGAKTDATINDVIVAAVGGAVRSYLLRHDELPEQSLVAFVPVSTRGEGDGGGNSTSLMYASMGTEVDDPAERLRIVSASTRRSKSAHKRGGAGVPTDLTAVAGSQAAALIGRALGDKRLVDRLRLGGNVVVSNIPGPSGQLYLAGVPVERLYPFGPVIEGNALNVTVLSYKRRHLSLGLVADRKAVPDLEQLTSDLRTSFDELQKAVLA